MGATRDALAETPQSVRETSSLLYKRMMENMGYGEEERLEDIKEKEAEKKQQKPTTKEDEEAKDQRQGPAASKEQQQEDDERYGTVAKIKLVYEGKRVKEFRVTGN